MDLLRRSGGAVRVRAAIALRGVGHRGGAVRAHRVRRREQAGRAQRSAVRPRPDAARGARCPLLARPGVVRIMPGVVVLDPEQRAMLNDALKGARTLVAELDARKKETDENPPAIDP